MAEDLSGYFRGHPKNLVGVALSPKRDRELIVEVDFTVMGRKDLQLCWFKI